MKKVASFINLPTIKDKSKKLYPFSDQIGKKCCPISDQNT